MLNPVGSNNANIPGIVGDETPSHPKLLGYTTFSDENAEMTHLVEHQITGHYNGPS